MIKEQRVQETEILNTKLTHMFFYKLLPAYLMQYGLNQFILGIFIAAALIVIRYFAKLSNICISKHFRQIHSFIASPFYYHYGKVSDFYSA
ncbi:hypothetical protein D3C80_1624560 [compost metagenome]